MAKPKAMKNLADPVLITIMNNLSDFEIARDRHWYRIPVTSVEKWLSACWPPRRLAFYQTKVFGDEAYSVRHYAQVTDVRTAYRWELFPQEKGGEKHARRYYQLFLAPMQQLSRPIPSSSQRRIIFIPTIWQKLVNAEEINDLYHKSPLEDLLWSELKRLQIPAERQLFLNLSGQDLELDFAVYCRRGTLDIETDGDSWHSNPARARLDNIRDHALIVAGWRVLRFNTHQIRREMKTYCAPTVLHTIETLGGMA